MTPSLSPALESDLAAFGAAPDFARAPAHLVWIEPLPRLRPSWVEEMFFHAR